MVPLDLQIISSGTLEMCSFSGSWKCSRCIITIKRVETHVVAMFLLAFACVIIHFNAFFDNNRWKQLKFFACGEQQLFLDISVILNINSWNALQKAMLFVTIVCFFFQLQKIADLHILRSNNGSSGTFKLVTFYSRLGIVFLFVFVKFFFLLC